MSAVSAVATQQAMTQLKMTVAMTKAASNAQQAIVEMVASSVNAARGQNLNISV